MFDKRRTLRLLLAALLALGATGASCGEAAVRLMPGVINSPSNRSLRHAIFGFATDKLCAEVLRRSVPLKLRDGDPNIGRFFPAACSVRELANENLFVQFVGRGYAWTNVTGRMGFEASAAVEFEHDFFVDGSTMYVYFKQKKTQSLAFRALMIERGEGGAAAGVAGLLGSNVKQVSQQLGERLLKHQLAQGFTVLRESDGSVSFSLGVLDKGARPAGVPFARGDSDWQILANERSELHTNQRDFAGPFTISDPSEQALHLTAVVDGAPAVDLLVVPKATGDVWLSQYLHYGNTQGPQQPALFEDVIQQSVSAAGAAVSSGGPLPGPAPAQYRRQLKLPAGQYYLVFDNTATAGKTAPAGGPRDDRSALVSYGVQLGDAD